MAGVRGRGPAGAAAFMGRRRPPVGPRSLGAPNRHRQGCALYRDPSAVERRAPRATTHGPRTRVGRLAYGTDAVTRTGRAMTGRHPMLAGDPGCFLDLSRLRVLASVTVDRSPASA